jgi:ABC-type maltose transport system permease subunit
MCNVFLIMGSFIAVPMLTLFVLLQRHFIEGVSISGLKR